MKKTHQYFLCLDEPGLSERLQLDDLWDVLGACLKELSKSHDQHAVLVLQVCTLVHLCRHENLLLMILVNTLKGGLWAKISI